MATPTAGIACLSDGDTLKIESGTYNDGLRFPSSFTDGNEPTVTTTNATNDGDGAVTLNGEVTGDCWYGGAGAVLSVAGDNVIVDGAPNSTWTFWDGKPTTGFFLVGDTGMQHVVQIEGKAVIKHVTVEGSVANGNDSSGFTICGGEEDTEVSHWYLDDLTGSEFLVLTQIDGSGGGSGCTNTDATIKIHDFQINGGQTSDGYSAMRVNYTDYVETYNGLIRGVSSTSGAGPRILDNRQCCYNRWHDIYIETTNATHSIFSARGGTTPQNSNNHEFYNITIRVGTGTLSNSGIAFLGAYASGNNFKNIIVKGEADYFFMCDGALATNADNTGDYLRFTGNVTQADLIEGDASSGCWYGNDGEIVITNTQDNVGTSMLVGTGTNVWDQDKLSQSYDGSAATPKSTADAFGTVRDSTPDIGFHEYVTASGETINLTGGSQSITIGGGSQSITW